MHNLASLVEHLHLLLGVSVWLEHVNLWDNIVSQLVGKLLNGLYLTILNHLLVLLLQFGHSGCTCTRSTLIAGNMNALYVRNLLQRLQYYHHHDSCAVRVGDNAAWAVQCVFCIALRYYQGHIIVHTEST